MKKSILLIAAVLITLGASAQTDSTKKIVVPPDLQRTNDGMNRNDNDGNDNRHNQDRNQNQDRNNKQNSSQPRLTHSDSLVMQNGMKNHPDGVMMKNGTRWWYWIVQ